MQLLSMGAKFRSLPAKPRAIQGFTIRMKLLRTLLLLPAVALAVEKDKDDPNAPVSYFKKIRPIFQANCQGCHQPAKAKGGYVMTDFAKLLKGGEECAKDGDAAGSQGAPGTSTP